MKSKFELNRECEFDYVAQWGRVYQLLDRIISMELVIHFKGKFIRASFALSVYRYSADWRKQKWMGAADRRTLHEIETKRKLIAATAICSGIIWTNRDNCRLSYTQA